MDASAIEKINILTNGKYARDYFTENGLTYDDAKYVKERLIQLVKNNQLQARYVERNIHILVNQLRHNRGLTDEYEEAVSGYNQKKLLFIANNDSYNITCKKCNNDMGGNFKYCPYCGNKHEIKRVELIFTGNVDIQKGYITPEELKLGKLITEEERKLLDEGKVKLEDIGVPLDENNCPFEIRSEAIYKNELLVNDKKSREELYNKNMEIYKSEENKELIKPEDDHPSKNKLFPVDISKLDKIKKSEETKVKTILKTSSEEDDNNKTGHTSQIENEVIENTEDIKPKTTITNKPQETKTETNNQNKTKSLNDLKAKFNQAKKQVDTNLLYASVLYLIDVIKHPKKPKLSDNTLYWLDVSSNTKIINHIKKNNYIKEAEGLDIVKANLNSLKVKDLKVILSENGLKVSGKKVDLIDRICENVEMGKLSKYSKGKATIVTENGLKLIEENPQVELYIKYLKKFDIEIYDKFYQENKENIELKEIPIKSLEPIREELSDKMLWYTFEETYEIESKIYHDYKDDINELKAYMNYFICYINPWSNNTIAHYLHTMTADNRKEIQSVIDKSGLDFDNLLEIFRECTSNIKLPHLFLDADEMFEYFIRTYNNESLDILNNELNSKYHPDNLNYYSLNFETKLEQEEKYLEAKKYLN